MFAKDGEGQQIFKLSKILSAELSATVLSFSGAQDGAAKSVRYLTDRFNSKYCGRLEQIYLQNGHFCC